MMPYVRDILVPYEKALLKFNSRQKSKNTRYNIKKISSVLGREFQTETAKGLAKKFKLKCLFQEIFRKLFPRVTSVQMVFYMAIKGLFICDLEHEFA